MKKKTSKNIVMSLVFLCLMIIYLLPFFILFMNSFKGSLEISKNIIALPEKISLINYQKAWEKLNFPRTFTNTIVLVVIANVGLVILGSMAGYWLARYRNICNKIIFAVLLSAMAIPFETVMIPLMKVVTNLNLTQNIVSLGICYWGMGASTFIFMIYGAVKNVPIELEEAAGIDGCGPFRIFWAVVFPLLKTIIVTMVIINTFWVWNDYLMPQLMLGSAKELQTIQLSMRSLFMEYYSMWDIALAGLVISLLPTVVLYLFSQKYIISGITSGALKG